MEREFLGLVERFVEDSLDDRELQELRSLIGTNPSVREELVQALRFTGLFRAMLLTGE